MDNAMGDASMAFQGLSETAGIVFLAFNFKLN